MQRFGLEKKEKNNNFARFLKIFWDARQIIWDARQNLTLVKFWQDREIVQLQILKLQYLKTYQAKKNKKYTNGSKFARSTNRDLFCNILDNSFFLAIFLYEIYFSFTL